MASMAVAEDDVLAMAEFTYAKVFGKTLVITDGESDDMHAVRELNEAVGPDNLFLRVSEGKQLFSSCARMSNWLEAACEFPPSPDHISPGATSGRDFVEPEPRRAAFHKRYPLVCDRPTEIGEMSLVLLAKIESECIQTLVIIAPPRELVWLYNNHRDEYERVMASVKVVYMYGSFNMRCVLGEVDAAAFLRTLPNLHYTTNFIALGRGVANTINPSNTPKDVYPWLFAQPLFREFVEAWDKHMLLDCLTSVDKIRHKLIAISKDPEQAAPASGEGMFGLTDREYAKLHRNLKCGYEVSGKQFVMADLLLVVWMLTGDNKGGMNTARADITFSDAGYEQLEFKPDGHATVLNCTNRQAFFNALRALWRM